MKKGINNAPTIPNPKIYKYKLEKNDRGTQGTDDRLVG